MNKFTTVIGSEARKRTLEENFLPMLHFGFSASPQIFYPNATMAINELYEDEARFLLKKGNVRTSINPRHTLSVEKMKQLGFGVKIPAFKPYTRIAPGGSILVMQPVNADPSWLVDGRFCWDDNDLKRLKVMFRWIRVVERIDRKAFLQEPPFK
ncbi:MAG: hypothetical protein WCX77_03865 [Candidatus Paceibacterota bacterium]|jgi:hypothetical protein